MKALKKLAVIKLDRDYGGTTAWLVQESYDGVIADPFSHKVLKREYFSRLDEVVVHYLDRGFKVEIENQN